MSKSDSQQELIYPIAIQDEIQKSYLTYAMSVIIRRALPDVRDGLKPVHRRILYSMGEMGLFHNRPFRKSIRVIGDVLAHYHPHGEASVYDALVRLAQSFSLRNPLIQGQGNFGSIDGDPPAATRYTEARLSALSETMLRDLKKETVDYQSNFDNTCKEPVILPAAIPNLLVNGVSGIAVGMATNMPPHNLGEVAEAVCALIDNPEMPDTDLFQYIKGPDFPTGSIVQGMNGFRSASLTGRGEIITRGRHHLETLHDHREAIIVTEIPYLVNKSNMVVKIAELVHEKKVDGISDLRDESSLKGIRIVIELKKGGSPEIILNQLYAHTQLQTSFHVNNLALDNGKPKCFTLRGLLEAFISHRVEIITRRTQFDLKEAKERVHILEGLKIALVDIDTVIQLIRQAENTEIAAQSLISHFQLSERQAKAILEIRLQRLTSLEVQKVIDELEAKYQLIRELEDLLAHKEKIDNLIQQETRQIAKQYNTPRQSEISPVEVDGSITMEDLIQEQEVVVLISHQGFVKHIPVSEYKQQSRGGKGVRVSQLRNDDFIEHIFMTTTHHHILFISNRGKAYSLKVYELPEGSKNSKGRHIHNFFPFEENERVTAYVPIKEFCEKDFLFMATRFGTVKRISTHEFRNVKTRGIYAIKLDEGDSLVSAQLTDGSMNLLLLTHQGKGLRFNESEVRTMGRTARGVRGIRLKEDDYLVNVCCQNNKDSLVLLICENGIGKRMSFDLFAIHARGTMGQRSYKVNKRTGNVVDAKTVHPNDTIIATTEQGKAIHITTSKISSLGRSTSGVRLLNTDEGDKIAGLAVIPHQEEE